MQKLIPLSILILAMCSIQYGASVAKKLFPLAGVAGASSLRLLFASIILVLVFRPWKVKFKKEEWKSLSLYGISLGLMNLSFYYALQRIPLGIAVALEFTGPLAVALFASRKKVDFLWAFLAAAGIFLLLPKTDSSAALDPIGMFFALLAGFFWALYILFGKKAGDSHSGGVASAMGMAFAAVVVLPFGLTVDASRMFTAEALPIGLFVALFGSAIPYSLEMMALKKMPTKTFGVLMSLEPAVASLIGLIFLSEQLTVIQWLAISSVIISSLGSTLTHKD